jgi:hypothetical protein
VNRTKLHLYDLLWQQDVWRDRHGTDHQLGDMPPRHRRGALKAARRLAEPLWRTHQTELLLRNDDEGVYGHIRTLPERWIETTPLVEALARLVATDRVRASRPRRWWL